jgi:hypothetical protein
MKKKYNLLKAKAHNVLAGFAVMFIAAIFSVTLLGCPTGDDPTTPGSNDPELAGTIKIQKGGADVTAATTGDTLTAVWTAGADDPAVTYQWKKNNADVSGETGQTYAPTEAGSYTVTVSASGYKSKTSAAVNVTGSTLHPLAGTIKIKKGSDDVTTSVKTGITLTAAWTAEEGDPTTVTYQWKKNNADVSGATSQTYTPTEAGSYTVTVSAAGYTSKTSAAVEVISPGTIRITTSRSGDSGYVYDVLTAAYEGDEDEHDLSYNWKKDGIDIGGWDDDRQNGNLFLATEPGVYTVTVSIVYSGYGGFQGAMESSNSVTVIPPTADTFTGTTWKQRFASYPSTIRIEADGSIVFVTDNISGIQGIVGGDYAKITGASFVIGEKDDEGQYTVTYTGGTLTKTATEDYGMWAYVSGGSGWGWLDSVTKEGDGTPVWEDTVTFTFKYWRMYPNPDYPSSIRLGSESAYSKVEGQE